LTSSAPAIAAPAGAVSGSLSVSFPMGGGNTAQVGIHASAIGQALITGSSPQAAVNGDISVKVTSPVLIGHWLEGAPNLAETSGYRPPGTHDGVAVGGNAGSLAYSTDVPSGFSGQSLNLTAGNVGVMVANSATTDGAYQPTFDSIIASNLSVAFWAKGFPTTWSPWISKRGEDGIGWQIRRMGDDPIAGFTIRGLDNEDGWGSTINVNDAT